MDKLRDSYGKSLEFAAAVVPPDLEPRAVLLNRAAVELLAALGSDDIDVLVCGSRGDGPVRRVLLGGVSSRLIRRVLLPLVGLRGHGGFTGMLLGSVSQHVAAHAECNVIIVR